MDLHELLKALLNPEDSTLRETARRALADEGHRWMPQLVQALQDENPEIRYRAASALGELGDVAQEATSVLVASLSDENEWVRYYACYALGAIGKDTPQLAKSLCGMMNDKSWHVRQASNDAVAQLTHVDDNIAHGLARALNDSEWQVRSSAAEAIGILGIWNSSMLASFEGLMLHSESGLRSEAIATLGKVDAPIDWIVVQATRLLNDTDPFVRMTAAQTLIKAGAAATCAIPVLLENLSDSTLPDFVRDAMRAAIVAMGKDSLESLTKAYGDDRPLVRAEVAQMLGEIGEANPLIVAAVHRVMMDDNENLVRICAAGAFWRLTGNVETPLQVLIDGLRAKESSAVVHAATILGQMGKRANKAIDAIKDVVLERSDDARRAAAIAMIRLGRHDDKCPLLLIKLLEDKDYELRHIAVRGLGLLEHSIPEAAAALTKCLHCDGDPGLQAVAERSLNRLNNQRKARIMRRR